PDRAAWRPDRGSEPRRGPRHDLHRAPSPAPVTPARAGRACPMSQDDTQGSQNALADSGVAIRPVIAVFNGSADTVDLLRRVLEQDGLQTVVGHIPEIKHGALDLIAFVERHAPA